MFRPGTILNDTWEVKRRIGQGSFCELFLARNIVDRDAPMVAVKAQNSDIEASIIRVEGDVIRSLNDIPSVPKFYFYGQHGGIEYIVMELLGGEDMSKLRNRARAASHANLIALPVASFLSREILRSVKAIHEKGYIHRDIKPANFVRRDKSSSAFCMVDFGLARQYRNRDGSIRPKRESCEFRGTALYASPFIHEGEEQCPRDDLFSLIFVFCDLVCGKLPWSEAAKIKDKGKVATLKKQYLADPRRFVEWVKHQAEDADRIKRLTDGEPNFPPSAQEQCLVIIRHLQSLKYEDTPDYDLIDSAYCMSVGELSMAHDVAEIGYSYGGFDWSGGLDTTRSWGSGSGSGPLPHGPVAAAGMGSGGGGGEEKVDFAQLQRVLCARCRVLVKDIQRARRVLAANALALSNTPAPLLISVPLSVLIPAHASILASDMVCTPACDANTEMEDDVCQSADIQAYLELSSSTFFDQIAEGDADAATETTKVTIGAAPNSDVASSPSATHGGKAEERVAVSLLQPIEEEVNDAKYTEIETESNRAMETQTIQGVTTAIEEKDEEQCNPDVEVEAQTQVSATENSLDLGFDYDQLATLLVDSASPLPLPLPCTPACTSNSTYNEADIALDKTIKVTENIDVSIEGVLQDGDSSHADPLWASSSGEGSQPLLPPPPPSLATPVGDLGDVLINVKGSLPLPLPTTQPGQGEEPLSVSEQKSIISDLSGDITATPSASRKRVSTRHTVTNMPAARCTDLNLGLLWRDIASQALTIPEPLIQREILDSLDSLLKDAGRFFLCALGDEGQHWDEFMLLQKVAFSFVELVNRKNKSGSKRDSHAPGTLTPHTQTHTQTQAHSKLSTSRTPGHGGQEHLKKQKLQHI